MTATRSRLPIRPVLVAAVLFALLVAGGAAEAATRVVHIGQGGGLNYVDTVSGNSTTTINAGDGVSWVWSSGFHSTTCTAPCAQFWDSGEHSAPFTFTTVVFSNPGTYNYHCTVHGAGVMSGMVIVQAAGSAPVAHFDFTPTTPLITQTVTFHDTSTNTPTSWAWNFGDPASGTANTSTQQNPTHTFLAAGTYHVSLTATNASGSNTFTDEVTATSGGGLPCAPDDHTLCLNNNRFSVTAHWTKLDQTEGDGTGVKLTGDSGYFWFFDSANIEVVIKVLNACGQPAPAYWVFAAGLTNVEVDLKVLDTQTGLTFESVNPQGTPFAPIQATAAFPASCP